jgi:hypothetical protein
MGSTLHGCKDLAGIKHQGSLCHTGLRKRSNATARPLVLRDEINVLVADSAGRLEEVSTQDEALSEVRLRLQLKGWFTSNSSLVRLLLEGMHTQLECMHAWARSF